MPDVIQLLPDSVANQIAAGEVIQRPASVVKELMENALDAGATDIKVVVKEAGRTLVQVIDNGCGMSETDSRMAFERHATSKIREANDLFSLNTMGFRGEALASIAAVAQVELITRRPDDELGVRIEIAASKVEKQEMVQCASGTQFLVKNLFFNIPARRRFLKSNAAELKHISSEFYRVVLANPNVAFTLVHNDSVMHSLQQGNYRQRVSSLVGRNIGNQLVPVDSNTSIVHIHGFIGTPATARKSCSDQYFFVNNRFMRHPYLHRAVMDAYQKLINPDVSPVYFLYLEVDPQIIDVNIHPAKTEIKFENEQVVWQLVNAAVRESLGKFNVVPAIDFDTDDMIEIPSFNPEVTYAMPSFHSDPSYNPFESPSRGSGFSGGGSVAGWEAVYGTTFDSDEPGEEIVLSSMADALDGEAKQQQVLPSADDEKVASPVRFFQFKTRYIVTSVKSGLMLIDQKRAHERILFEEYMNVVTTHRMVTQQLLYPEQLSFADEDAAVMREFMPVLKEIGLVVEEEEEEGCFKVVSVPSQLIGMSVAVLVDGLMYDYKNGEIDARERVKEMIVRSMAAQSAISYGKTLSNEEMNNLFDRLFACEMPNYSPFGKAIISIVDTDYIDSLFK